ncbi:MAG: DNA-binding domain-containing protein [Candidatus Electronema sp. V4]|uniref:DNA-binding domain-containing protein n=1 Tax=Candidatus Electronema sp. V4 TaxID=3454756 RepID=UPI004055592F
MALQYRLERNPLTTPASYSIRFVPRNVANKEDIAADIALRHPHFSKADILTILNAEDEAVQARLLNGEQVTKEGSFSWYLSFTGRLESPDEPLPPLDDCLQVNVRVSPPFLAAIRQNAQTERLPMEKKLPLISTAKDTLLELKDVLNPAGALQLTGDDLYFDRKQGAGECVIEGTQSGKTVQKRFIKIEASEIILMPDIPAQAHPWNNEYKVSVSTRYSEHGSLRTGTYERMLRSPLTLTNMGHPNPPEVGILTGSAASAYVSVTGGSVSADETLRIQVILDLRADALLFSLLDMKEDGRAGAAMTVTANSAVTLQGFADSAVSSLTVRVNNYAGLKEMLRNDYGGRLVDVLELRE